MRRLLLIALAASLAACGGGREQLAAKACEKAVREKLSDKQIELNLKQMAASAEPDDDDVVRIQSDVVFDPGLPREYTQTFDCRARFSAGKSEPDVIALSFQW